MRTAGEGIFWNAVRRGVKARDEVIAALGIRWGGDSDAPDTVAGHSASAVGSGRTDRTLVGQDDEQVSQVPGTDRLVWCDAQRFGEPSWHFGRGQPEQRRVRVGVRKGGLGQVELASELPHPLIVGPAVGVEQDDTGRVAGERPVDESVN